MNDSDESIRTACYAIGAGEAMADPVLARRIVDSMSANYLTKVRACHDLASLLKRTRPMVQPQVVELEGIVKRAHDVLEGHPGYGSPSDARGNIEGAYHALLQLRRAGR